MTCAPNDVLFLEVCVCTGHCVRCVGWKTPSTRHSEWWRHLANWITFAACPVFAAVLCDAGFLQVVKIYYDILWQNLSFLNDTGKHNGLYSSNSMLVCVVHCTILAKGWSSWARLAQSVEHQTFNESSGYLRVKGSSPLSGANFF